LDRKTRAPGRDIRHTVARGAGVCGITSPASDPGELVPKFAPLAQKTGPERVAHSAVAAPMGRFLNTLPAPPPLTIGMSRVAGFVMAAPSAPPISGNGSVHSPDDT